MTLAARVIINDVTAGRLGICAATLDAIIMSHEVEVVQVEPRKEVFQVKLKILILGVI